MMNHIDVIDLVIAEKKRRQQIQEEESRRLQLELPVYERVVEKQEEEKEPRRVIIIDL
jgi:hypothetical protein